MEQTTGEVKKQKAGGTRVQKGGGSSVPLIVLGVALAVLELRYADLQFHDYARDVRQGDQPEFRRWLAFYKEKYLGPAPV